MGRQAGLGLAAGSGLLYGSINVLAKVLDQQGVVHPFVKSATAYLASAALLSPALRGFRVARRDWWKVAVMGLWDPLESTCRHASLSIL